MDDKSSSGKKQRTVYQILEKPGRDKAVWMRIGVAYVNHDQSINVYLDAIPYERKLQIREEEVRPRPPRTSGAARPRSSRPSISAASSEPRALAAVLLTLSFASARAESMARYLTAPSVVRRRRRSRATAWST